MNEHHPIWSTNADPADVARFLRDKHRVVVLTHAKPDGDAAGSALAVTRALNLAGTDPSRATAHFFGPNPPWLRDVANHPEPTPHALHENTIMPDAERADAVVVVDTGSWTQLEPVRSWLKSRAAQTCLIDHHVRGDADVAQLRLIDTSAAAACQPVALVCMEILDVTAPASLPASVAEALYMGLATDTGWFRHSNVNRAVMHLAGELLDAGADNVWLYQCIEQRESPGRLRLISRALSTLELHHGGRLATMTLTLEDMRASGALPGETGGITDFSQNIPSVQCSAVLMETPPAKDDPTGTSPLIKISLRSKPGPIDVNAIAGKLGGGGHVRAAGAKLRSSLDEARALVVRLVGESLHA